MMLDNVDRLTAQITALDATIEEVIGPFAAQVAQLDEVTGIGVTAAQDLIAEIGVDMSRFPSDAHLVSWAGQKIVIRNGKATIVEPQAA
jgi:transposase